MRRIRQEGSERWAALAEIRTLQQRLDHLATAPQGVADAATDAVRNRIILVLEDRYIEP